MKFAEWLEAKVLSEINWEDEFEDVKKQCISQKEIVKYLNAVKKNASRPYGEREKFPANKPFVHAKSSFFKKGQEEVDLDYFADQITKSPKTLVNTNEKILKSGGPNEFVYKTGIPAFRGIAYDQNKEEFVYINTCPGAGVCVLFCYARKGRYIQYPNSYDLMTRRLNLLLNDLIFACFEVLSPHNINFDNAPAVIGLFQSSLLRCLSKYLFLLSLSP